MSASREILGRSSVVGLQIRTAEELETINEAVSKSIGGWEHVSISSLAERLPNMTLDTIESTVIGVMTEKLLEVYKQSKPTDILSEDSKEIVLKKLKVLIMDITDARIEFECEKHILLISAAKIVAMLRDYTFDEDQHQRVANINEATGLFMKRNSEFLANTRE